jgi:hypothetical protein
VKILTAILSIYFLGLSFVPCADSAPEEKDSVSIENHCSDENHLDLCAPFCLCQCCHSVVVMEKSPYVVMAIPSFPEQIISKGKNLQAEFLDPLLQPPQV